MSDTAGLTKMHACPRCGFLLNSTESDCPYCASQRDTTTWPRERVLAVSASVLVSLFAVTGYAARIYHARTKWFAQQWCERGRAELAAGRPDEAAKSLHNTYFYNPQDISCQLDLVRALMAGKHYVEAQHHLEGVLAQDPGNGEANLALAELEAARGEYAEAVRHYHNAIYGVWPVNDEVPRANARLELVKFLLAHGANEDALGELVGLAANSASQGGAFHQQLGKLFLEAGSPDRALEEFQVAMRAGQESAETYAKAGEAAYETGKYRDALGYLEQAAPGENEKAGVEVMLADLRKVMDADPQAPGISREERLIRMEVAYDQAIIRLNECSESANSSGSNTLLKVVQAQAAGLKKTLKDPGRAPEVMEFAFDAERRALAACGSPRGGFDQTLLLLSRQAGGPGK
jgi:tetratricopeptide (TPR) repeat protein